MELDGANFYFKHQQQLNTTVDDRSITKRRKSTNARVPQIIILHFFCYFSVDVWFIIHLKRIHHYSYRRKVARGSRLSWSHRLWRSICSSKQCICQLQPKSRPIDNLYVEYHLFRPLANRIIFPTKEP